MIKKIRFTFNDNSIYEKEILQPYSFQLFTNNNIKRVRIIKNILLESSNNIIMEIFKNIKDKHIIKLEYIVDDISIGNIISDNFRISYSIDDDVYKDFNNNIIVEKLDIISEDDY